MKNFLKLFALILVLGISSQVSGQILFGIKAGLNGNNISQNFKESDWEDDTKMRAGFHLGLTVDYELSEQLSLQSGLLYSSKGYSIDLEADLDPDETVDGYQRAIVNYLEIPIHFAYKMNDLQLYAGPYIGIGIGGKMKWDVTYKYDGEEYKSDGDISLKPVFGEVDSNDLDDDESPYNALDFGLNLGAGYQVGPILINAGYSLGLGNLTPKEKDSDFDPKDMKTSNRVLSLSVSYFFGI